MPRRKQREERWIGANWAVSVDDGNGDNWYTFHADAGPIVLVGPNKAVGKRMDRATAHDISRALRAAADFLDERKLPPGGGGEVVQLRKSKEAKD